MTWIQRHVRDLDERRWQKAKLVVVRATRKSFPLARIARDVGAPVESRVWWSYRNDAADDHFRAYTLPLFVTDLDVGRTNWSTGCNQVGIPTTRFGVRVPTLGAPVLATSRYKTIQLQHLWLPDAVAAIRAWRDALLAAHAAHVASLTEDGFVRAVFPDSAAAVMPSVLAAQCADVATRFKNLAAGRAGTYWQWQALRRDIALLLVDVRQLADLCKTRPRPLRGGSALFFAGWEAAVKTFRRALPDMADALRTQLAVCDEEASAREERGLFACTLLSLS